MPRSEVIVVSTALAYPPHRGTVHPVASNPVLVARRFRRRGARPRVVHQFEIDEGQQQVARPPAPCHIRFMPRGPKGEKRPADTIGAAIKVARIATGEVEDETSPMPGRAEGGKKGGVARAAKLSAEQRSEIARKAAQARWHR